MFKNYVEKVENAKLTISGGKIKQTERNELKELAVEGLLDLLSNQGVDCFRVEKGIAVVVDNTPSKKPITFVINPVFKNTTYDLDADIQAYEEKVEAAKERARKREETKAAKLAAKKGEKSSETESAE